MTEAEADKIISEQIKKHADGCCMNDAWRDRPCSYHLGMLDGAGIMSDFIFNECKDA